MIRYALLLLIPIAPVLHLLGAPPVAVFAVGLAAIAVCAEWIRAATDGLASHTGPAIGGLLSVSLGSLAELILALFVLTAGAADVVHAQITGSILATSLLGLGLSIVVGGVTRERQVFKRERAGLLSSLLILATIALLLPATFDFTERAVLHAPHVAISDEALSIAISVVLLLLYAGNLIFTLVTHRDVFGSGEPAAAEPGGWPLWGCLGVLVVATALAAWQAELVSAALEPAAAALHLSNLFVGVVVLALVGTIADLFAAVFFARKDRMGLVMSICIGSSIQIVMVVAPVLVIASALLGKPMSLVFTNPLELISIAATCFIVNTVAADGETTWFEGMMLIGVYAVLCLAFFFAG